MVVELLAAGSSDSLEGLAAALRRLAAGRWPRLARKYSPNLIPILPVVLAVLAVNALDGATGTRETAASGSPLPAVLAFRATHAPDLLIASANPGRSQSDRGASARAGGGEFGQGASNPRGNQQPSAIKERPTTPFTYKVAPGDTASGIAEKFGVSTDTVLTANDVSDPDALQVGDELTILPVSGVVHTITDGDTLVDLAAMYGVSAESIATYNALADPLALQLGAKLVVPGGKIQVTRLSGSSRGGARPGATGSFRWPTVGPITTYFGGGHRGIDIAAPAGVPVYVTDGGIVVTALKLNYDYGYHLIIDHGNGYRTVYAHLSAFYVDYGEKVSRGDRIGAVGSTGLSTGPHLHFEVWENGVKVDPLNYLP